jgi:O-methyltransferase
MLSKSIDALLSQSRSNNPIRYFVDQCGADGIRGWAIHESGIKQIRVFADGRVVGQPAGCSIVRPDVHSVYPDIKDSLLSGFAMPLSGAEGLADLTIEIAANDGTLENRAIGKIYWGREGIGDNAFREGTDQPIRSGFPFEVSKFLTRFRPGVYPLDRTWSDDLMRRATEDLTQFWNSHARIAPLNRYILFLTAMYQRMRKISRHFPSINSLAAADAKDSVGVASSAEEMMAIANHLYVLKSNGLTGHFLEFGCFKGFSSSCLSNCCHELGIPMEIFDSFAGLPASDSAYYNEGEFCGTITEVTSNVAEFGQPDAVTYHKGFFADTLPSFEKSPVLCMWMDVDLHSSARDVAQILDRLPRTSALFTHESIPAVFASEEINPQVSEVFPPIMEKFASLGRQVTGRHVDGCL